MPTTIIDLGEQFVEQGRYLRGWSPKTVRTYRQALATFSAEHIGTVSRTSLQAFGIALRRRGLSPDGINVGLRTINSFLRGCTAKGT
jgi:hypothetical protein